jgi:hypothetical protein
MARNNVQPHPLKALLVEMEHPGGVIGKINDTTVHVRAAVINPYDHRPMVVQVSHPNQGA